MFQDRKDARTEYAYIIQYIHKHNILAQLLMIITFNKRRKKKLCLNCLHQKTGGM